MRRNSMRLRLWHLMAIVAGAGLIAGGYVWLLPPGTDLHRHDFHAFMYVGVYVVPHTSPAFWVILGLELAALMGLFVGFIAVFVRITKAIKCIIIRKC
jgi:hypothetical protein